MMTLGGGLKVMMLTMLVVGMIMSGMVRIGMLVTGRMKPQGAASQAEPSPEPQKSEQPVGSLVIKCLGL